jgi:hypothetical protein
VVGKCCLIHHNVSKREDALLVEVNVEYIPKGYHLHQWMAAEVLVYFLGGLVKTPHPFIFCISISFFSFSKLR